MAAQLERSPRGRHFIGAGALRHEGTPVENVVAAVAEWLPRLGLAGWRIELEVSSELATGVMMQIRRSDFHDRAVRRRADRNLALDDLGRLARAAPGSASSASPTLAC